VPEEDHPQYRHEVIDGSQLEVGAQIGRGFPMFGFKLLDVLKVSGKW
jgi:hypothetical protein